MRIGAMRAGVVGAIALGVLGPGPRFVAAQTRGPATPPEMVASYDALADAILGANKAERKLVYAILAATYGHAQSELARARAALKGNDAAGARAAIETLASAVGQIGTEGDNAVAGVRKRLLEGGHHANATGEAQGIYDEGFVIVTKAAKQKFLDSSKRIAQMASAPKAAGLDEEWKAVEATYAGLMKPAR